MKFLFLSLAALCATGAWAGIPGGPAEPMAPPPASIEPTVCYGFCTALEEKVTHSEFRGGFADAAFGRNLHEAAENLDKRCSKAGGLITYQWIMEETGPVPGQSQVLRQRSVTPAWFCRPLPVIKQSE